MSSVRPGHVPSLTDQNFSHSAKENKMLLSIELSRERIRDMERRYTDPYAIHRPGTVRRGRRPIVAGAIRLGQVLTNRRVLTKDAS
jgi:hypothetical protein